MPKMNLWHRENPLTILSSALKPRAQPNILLTICWKPKLLHWLAN